MKVKASEDLQVGTIIALGPNVSTIAAFDAKEGGKFAIGIIIHDIKQGDIIKYNPMENTNDVLIKISKEESGNNT